MPSLIAAVPHSVFLIFTSANRLEIASISDEDTFTDLNSQSRRVRFSSTVSTLCERIGRQ